MAVKLESSLTDLMTSLAVIFIMLMLALVNSIGRAGQSDISKVEDLLRDALISQQLECVNNKERGDPLSCTITLPYENLHFAQGHFEIDQLGKKYIENIFPALMKVLSRKDIAKSIDSVTVSGFTDPRGTDHENLWLSQQRSLAIGLHLLRDVFAGRLEKKRSDRDLLLQWLFLTGRGEQDLIYKVDGGVDYSRSRRVEVTIRVKSLSKKAVEVSKKVTKKIQGLTDD